MNEKDANPERPENGEPLARGLPIATPSGVGQQAGPAPEPRPNPLAHLPLPFAAVDYSLKGYHLEAAVQPDQVVSAAQHLDREGFSLDTITGVDWLAQGQMEVVYDYFHSSRGLRAVVRTRIPRENPEIPTLSNVFPGANWHERETHDFFGIRFLCAPRGRVNHCVGATIRGLTFVDP